MNQDVVYIHYGHDQFRTPDPICNCDWRTKPRGGLWASRIDDPRGWKDWCEAEEFRLSSFDKYFKFKLKTDARVLELDDEKCLDYLPTLRPYHKDSADIFSMCVPDFEELEREYDAVEVTAIDKLYYPLYGWDCNSILVMNPDVIDVLDEEETDDQRSARQAFELVTAAMAASIRSPDGKLNKKDIVDMGVRIGFLTPEQADELMKNLKEDE